MSFFLCLDALSASETCPELYFEDFEAGWTEPSFLASRDLRTVWGRDMGLPEPGSLSRRKALEPVQGKKTGIKADLAMSQSSMEPSKWQQSPGFP